MNNLDFMKKFKPDIRSIKEFEHWIICIRGKQVTLGSAVILLKREVESLAEMLPEESAEFPKVVKWYEEVCTKKMGAIKFNYLVLMMKDSFVHYHTFPRYDKEIKQFGIEWIDSDWPRAIDINNGVELSEEKLEEIKNYMSE